MLVHVRTVFLPHHKQSSEFLACNPATYEVKNSVQNIIHVLQHPRQWFFFCLGFLRNDLYLDY